MTIAAGFNFEDGVLLCADTRHSAGWTIQASKIFRQEYKSGVKSIIAFAGKVRFARMAMQQIEGHLRISKALTHDEVRDEIVTVLLKFYQDHIFPHPDRALQNGPDFNLLIGLWSPSEKTSALYCTDETAINRLTGYDCIGTGESLRTLHYQVSF